ncbi:Rib/alpha-like domain-containing protein [Winkia neuii]|uniref:Rib/alpha-like domain-containing protein n=1 Tax=Winkia neuii TaxID=33007 RepID=UPI0023A9BB05|nr:Rib/alpha-like domain-containing protein [Winkia neuii]WEB56590.1 YPDG domain-containing protein [Winkia neuii]
MKKNKANEVLRKHAAGAIGAGISTVLILGSMGSVALAAPPASSSTDAPSAHSSDPAKSIHCGGAVAKNFFLVDGLTKDEVQEVLTRKLTEQGLNPSDYTITIEDSKIKKANAGSYGDGRRNRVMTVEVTITPKAAGAPAVTCNTRILYYTPPFAFLDKGKFPQNHTHHNVGKLVVDNPDSYTISPEDKVKLIDAFLKANPNLQLEKSQLQMDDNGNLTITNKAGEDPYSVTVPAEEFVSVVGKVKDILVFLDPATGNKLSTEVPAVRVPLKAGNWDDSDLWGTNNAGANRNLSAKAQLSGLDLKREGNELVISGKFDSSISNNAGGTRYLGIHRNSSKEYNYTQSFSNGFKVRVVPLKEDIVVRNLDKDAKFTQADVEKLIDVDYKKLNPLKFNQDKGLTAAQIRADVNSKIIRKISVDGLKHELGTQEFSGTLRTDLNVVSPVLKATAIYYTEKIPATLVSDPDKLTPDQIAEITSKVKKVNKLKDTDKVTVDKAGNVTIEFKRDKNDHNKVNATKKFKAPLAQAKYPDGKVETGKSIESPITTPEGYKFPTGTKFVVDGDAPDGLTVGQDGKITYNAPKDKTPGDLTGKVLVTLPDKKTPISVPFKITVIPAVPEMSYPDKKVEAGKSVETPITTPDGYTFPKGSKFEVKDAPKGVTVDETGKITYNAPKDKTPGEVTGKILVTLPGHDKPTAVPYKITVIPAVPEMSYPDKKVEAGKSVDVPVTTPDGYKFPTGTKFVVDGDAPDGLTVGQDGKITYNAPKDKTPGEVTGKILVTLPGHDKPTAVPYKITVIPAVPEMSYPDKKVEAGKSVETPITTPDGYTFPKGSKFEVKDAPKGVTVDETGKITYNAPKDKTPGEVTGKILVTLPGHDKPTPVPFKITVTPVEPKASYEDKKVPAGESTEVIPTPADGYKFPTGTTFTIDGKTPDGLTIDPKTGKITYTAPKDTNPVTLLARSR